VLAVSESLARWFSLPILRETAQLKTGVVLPEMREIGECVSTGEPTRLVPSVVPHLDPLDDGLSCRKCFEPSEFINLVSKLFFETQRWPYLIPARIFGLTDERPSLYIVGGTEGVLKVSLGPAPRGDQKQGPVPMVEL
jgi:hypothetical protein